MKFFSRLLALSSMVLLLLSFAAMAAPFANASQLDGVNVHSLWGSETTSQMYAELDVAQSANVKVLRVDVDWSAYEPDGPGQYAQDSVERLTEFMQGAAARGIKVLPTVFGTPCWASSAPASDTQGCQGDWWNRDVERWAPTDDSAYGDFLQWLTSNYGADLAGVEIWNEPNESASWAAPGDPVQAYADLVKAGYTGAKLGNPNVPVIAGALAGADVDYYEQLVQDGIEGYYDGFSIHTYPGANSPLFDPGNAAGRVATVVPGVEMFHAAQVANGDNTPVWVTEFGWQTQAGLYSAVTEQQQATFVTTAFQSLQALPYVASAIIYDLRDGPDATNYMDHYGLMTADFQPKPALAAMQAALANPAAPTTDSGPSSAAGFPTDTNTGSTDGTADGSDNAAAATVQTPTAGGGETGGETPPGTTATTTQSTTTTPATTLSSTTAPTTATTVSATTSDTVLYATSKLGSLRAGNAYDRSAGVYRVAIWHVGGALKVLKVAAQSQPFDVTLAKVHGLVKLVFARCSSRCKLFTSAVSGSQAAQPLQDAPAGSDYMPSLRHGELSFVSKVGANTRTCEAHLTGSGLAGTSCETMKVMTGNAKALESADTRVVVMRRARNLRPVQLAVVAD
jgi:hypothetical protein